MSGKPHRPRAAEDEEDKKPLPADDEEEMAAEDGEEEPSAEDGEDDEEEKPAMKKPASYQKLKAALVGADAEFIVAQLDKGASVKSATRAWMAEQNSRLAAAKKTPASAPKSRGVEPVGTRSFGAASSGGGNPVAEFDAAVRANMGQGMSRQKAVLAAANADPELHEAYVMATAHTHQPQSVSRRVKGA